MIVLGNLVNNAIKFTDHGSVIVYIIPKLIRKEMIRIYFAIKDTGIGIPTGKLQSIFEDFVQVTVIDEVGLIPTNVNGQNSQIRGKGIVVPAIFLDYLQRKKGTQQLENFGWNTITVAGTILTGGELAAARTFSAAWWWAAADLTYTFSAPALKLFREDVEKKYGKEFSDKLYKGLDAVEYIFVAKGAADLLKVDIPDITTVLASKNAIGEVEFYNLLEESIRADRPDLPDNKIQEILDDAKVAMDKLESEISSELLESELAKIRRLLDDTDEIIESGIRRYNIADEFANGATTVTREIVHNGNTIELKWILDDNGQISFGDRKKLRTLLGTTEDEAHHILTWTKSGDHIIVQAAAKDGFHLNMLENGVGLEKYSADFDTGLHGNHPQYDNYVVHRLFEFKQAFPDYTPKSANKFIQETLIPELNELIEEAGGSSLNLNEYFKQIINPPLGTLLTN